MADHSPGNHCIYCMCHSTENLYRWGRLLQPGQFACNIVHVQSACKIVPAAAAATRSSTARCSKALAYPQCSSRVSSPTSLRLPLEQNVGHRCCACVRRPLPQGAASFHSHVGACAFNLVFLSALVWGSFEIQVTYLYSRYTTADFGTQPQQVHQTTSTPGSPHHPDRTWGHVLLTLSFCQPSCSCICACSQPRCECRFQDTAVARASDDFHPRQAASSHPHVGACAIDHCFLSAFVQPDKSHCWLLTARS